ncbi:hypothetical protein J6590_087652 [Homalodisca vitripennis]|nr:hypothetical protein J6590_087652 [Homalodisca vitripennis]
MDMAGVRGVALSWFRSFLTGREQRVRVGHAVSAPLPGNEEEIQTLGAEIKILESQLDLEKDIRQKEMDTPFKSPGPINV